MIVDIEWRIPWPAEWDAVKKELAAMKLAEYAKQGTFFESKRRMRLMGVEVSAAGNESPYLRFQLEG